MLRRGNHQREVLAAGPAAGHRPLSRAEDPQVLPRRRCVRLTQAVPAPGGGQTYWYAIRLEGERRTGAKHRPSAEAAGGSPLEEAKGLLTIVSGIGRVVDRAALVAKVEWHAGELFPRVGFVVTTSGGGARSVSSSSTTGGARRSGSRREAGVELDAVILPTVPDNQVRLQLFALAYNLEPPAEVGAAPAGPDVDADHAAGEADQDRGESRPPRQGRHVPDGGGGGAPGVVRGDPGADRSTASDAEPRVIVHRGRMGVGGAEEGGWCRREVSATCRGTGRWGPLGRSAGHPARQPPGLLRFPSGHEHRPCPIRVQEGRARSWTTRGKLIWEIPAEWRRAAPLGGPSGGAARSGSSPDGGDPKGLRERSE